MDGHVTTIAAPAWHHYHAFGMTIRSRLPLPAAEVPPLAQPDVEIVDGLTPAVLPEAVTRESWFHAAPGLLLLTIEGVARYLVAAGRRITIHRRADVTDDEVRVFLLGSALGALLQQRRVLVLHGSAVEVGGEAVAFLGPRGVGKSTLATALWRRGCPVVTDDLCVITRGPTGRPVIAAGLLRTKLAADALEHLGIAAASLPLVDPTLKKRALPTGGARAVGPLPLSRVYELEAIDCDQISIAALQGADKFRAVMRHTYRLCFTEGLGVQDSHFRHALALAAQTDMAVVRRPRQPIRLRELTECILADLDRPSGRSSGAAADQW
jgi:hypothetical protein